MVIALLPLQGRAFESCSKFASNSYETCHLKFDHYTNPTSDSTSYLHLVNRRHIHDMRNIFSILESLSLYVIVMRATYPIIHYLSQSIAIHSRAVLQDLKSPLSDNRTTVK